MTFCVTEQSILTLSMVQKSEVLFFQDISTALPVIESGALKKDFKITICAHAGSCAGYLEAISLYKDQKELLFDKDTLYRVLSVRDSQAVLEVILP